MRAAVCERSRLHRGHGVSADVYGSPPGWLAGTGLGDDIGLASRVPSGDPGVPATASDPAPGAYGLEGIGHIRVSRPNPRAHHVPRIGPGRGYRVRREAGE
jgi:hypothetical protein